MLQTWLDDGLQGSRRAQRHLGALLGLATDAPRPEPYWLTWCELLLRPGLTAAPSDPPGAPASRLLDGLAQRLCDPDTTPHELFGQAGHEAETALALGRWAAAGRRPPEDPWHRPPPLAADATLARACTPLELALLQHHLEGRPLDPAAAPTWTTVLLVADDAAPGERGHLAQLLLWRLPDALAGNAAPLGDGRPPADEVLVRAPAMLLLPQNAAFQQGLAQVATLLRACLPAPRPALAWSLRPLPRVEPGTGTDRTWVMGELRGASTTVALVVAALHVVRWRLPVDTPGLAAAQRRLHRIAPERLGITACLRDGVQPAFGADPLAWPLEPIQGLDDKLDAFHHYREDLALQTHQSAAPRWPLVAAEQPLKAGGKEEEILRAATLADALAEAEAAQGEPLPEPLQHLLSELLEADLPPEVLPALRATEPPASPFARPATARRAPAPPEAAPDPARWGPMPRPRAELLHKAQAVKQPAEGSLSPGSAAALEHHLLRRLARWAGGEHLQFEARDGRADPVRLAEDFIAIDIDPSAHPAVVERKKAEYKAAGVPDDQIDARLAEYFRVNSLALLLHERERFGDAELFVLTAAPSAGKTTMLAEFEMQAAWRALRRHAACGQWGTVALWVPLRELKGPGLRGLVQADGELCSAEQAMDRWLAAHLGSVAPSWQALLDGPQVRQQGLRLAFLFDGANELRCPPTRREAFLRDLISLCPRADQPHTLPPVVTVRTLDSGFAVHGQCIGRLRPWDRGRRVSYVNNRLGAGSAQAQALLRLMGDLDDGAGSAGASQDAADPTLYDSPGLLAIACSLTRLGWLPQPTTNRAQLYATLWWARLFAEIQAKDTGTAAIPGEPVDWNALLSPAEQQAIRNLRERLNRGDWGWPEPAGPLVQALRDQATRMQWPDSAVADAAASGPPTESDVVLQAPAHSFFPGQPPAQRRSLLHAAARLQLLEQAGEGRGRADTHEEHTEWQWCHHTLLEFMAAWGLDPDGPLPDLRVPPYPEDLEAAYQRHLAHEAQREQDARAAGRQFDRTPFQLPKAMASVHSETVRMAAQLRRNAVRWTEVLVALGNPELAARVALDGWEAFGEPRTRTLDAWRPAGREVPAREGKGRRLAQAEGHTHPVLNALRQALHQRMTDPAVHPASRLASGDLLGELGGDPRFEICGQALILKDEHWAWIGPEGGSFSYLMGSKEFPDSVAADGELLPVTLRSFRAAGLLLTNAQYRCFLENGDAQAPQWWPGTAAKGASSQPWSIRQGEGGLQPLMGVLWHGQAYALWEQQQRRQAGQGNASHGVRLPTEVELEATQRSHPGSGAAARTGRWRYPYAAGKPGAGRTAPPDLRPWHFNHDQVVGYRSTPVGMWVQANLGRLADLVGNVWTWTSSRYTYRLEAAVVNAPLPTQVDDEFRCALRGGSFLSTAALCALGFRNLYHPGNGSGNNGFRMVVGEVSPIQNPGP